MSKQKAANKKGFTLMELLVVVIIIGVLAAIAVPGYMRAVEKSRTAGAIQTLSDIAKAENDYYNARSKYTNDFGDLVLKITDENTMEDADHSSYKTKFFTYNLDSYQDAVTASRQKGENSYTLYRFYEDPITYCQPEDNKYCKALGLPAGTFTLSIGAWQSCPGGTYPCSMNCARGTTTGYSCYGTYNADGSFSEKICSAPTSNGQVFCTSATYDDEGKKTRQLVCDIEITDKCVGRVEKFYDEYGNLLYARRCTNNNDDGSCSAYLHSGDQFTYDANGNKLTKRSCQIVASDGSCSAYQNGNAYDYTYDANGNMLTQRCCKTVAADGSCSAYQNVDAYDYTYDANGNLLTQRDCQTVAADGSCSVYKTSRYDYTYDANGNRLTQRSCKTVAADGSCSAYKTSGNYDYTYDANGRKLTERNCQTVAADGSCSTYLSFGNYDYTYDANGNIVTRSTCQIKADGSCGGYSSENYYTYDANGNKLTERTCQSVASDGSCKSYSSGNDNAYDEDGNKIAYRNCQTWSGTTCTEWLTYIYNY